MHNTDQAAWASDHIPVQAAPADKVDVKVSAAHSRLTNNAAPLNGLSLQATEDAGLSVRQGPVANLQLCGAKRKRALPQLFADMTEPNEIKKVQRKETILSEASAMIASTDEMQSEGDPLLAQHSLKSSFAIVTLQDIESLFGDPLTCPL